MKTKNISVQRAQAFHIILLSIVFLWLALLTRYALDSRSQQLHQAESDSQAIYQLMVENSDQQEMIDELSK